MGTELSSNEISLNDGQNIFRVNGISDFEPKVAVENGEKMFEVLPIGEMKTKIKTDEQHQA